MRCVPIGWHAVASAHGALGTLANAETRDWRSKAHRALDPLWKTGGQSRSAVYRWLAGQLGVPEDQAHIAMMDPDQCRRVIEACHEGEKPQRSNHRDRQCR